MTGLKREYQLLIYKHDAEWADPEVPEVEWTFTDAMIAHDGIGDHGGQIVRLIRGRTESRPWTVTLLDTAEQVTQKLADANGRATFLLRLATLQVKDDDGSWTDRVTARLTDVVSGEETEYTLTFEDERVKERNAVLFPLADTCTVYPGGLVPEYQQFTNNITGESLWWAAYPGPVAVYQYFFVKDKTGDAVLVELTGNEYNGPNGGPSGVWDVALNVITDDVQIADDEPRVSGNFEHLRFYYRTGPGTGTDVEIRYFGQGGFDTSPANAFRTTEGADEAVKKIMLYWPSCPLNEGDGGKCFLYAPTRPPDDVLPFHIGYLNNEAIPGPIWIGSHVELFSLVKAIYDGAYQDPNETPVTIRYNPDVFDTWDPTTNPIGLIGNPRVSIDGIGFRIRKPATMSEWLEDNVYGPFGVVPFVDEQGRVSPRPVMLPTADEIDIATLPELTDQNIAAGGEEWRHPRREIITRVIVNYYPESASQWFYVDPNRPAYAVDSLDLFQQWASPLTWEHDLIDRFGVEEIEYDLQVHYIYMANWVGEDLARSVLQRYGDGPQYTVLETLPNAPDLGAGDFVKVSGTFWPKLNQVPPTRGDATVRIGQVIQKVWSELAPEYVILDIGAALQPLGTLTVACALNSGNSDWVDITISGLATGALYRLQYTINPGTVTHDDKLWVQRATGSANETITIKGLPKGAKTHWRAQAYQEGRISSLWSNICVVTVASLTAPSSCYVDAYSATTAVVGWTVGESEQPLEILLDDVHYAWLPIGTQLFTFPYLEPDTTYKVGIRHFDAGGGVSGLCEVYLTTLPPDTEPICQPVDMVLYIGGVCS